MGSFEYKALGVASIVFLVCFVLLLGLSSLILFTLGGLKNRYTLLLVFSLIRTGGQIAGIGFAKLGTSNTNWLIAYLVLSAEGYLALIFSMSRFLIHQQRLSLGYSYVTAPFFRKLSINSATHIILVVSNAIVIAGSVLVVHMSPEEYFHSDKKVTAEVLKTVGQVLFLLCSVLFSVLILLTCFKSNVRTPTMICLMALTPFILVRGIFGILAIYIDKMNYLHITNYFSNQKMTTLVIYEYCLGVLMEFLTACCFILAFFVDKPGRQKVSIQEEDKDSI